MGVSHHFCQRWSDGTESVSNSNVKHKANLTKFSIPLIKKQKKKLTALVISKGDSAASQNYWREEDKHFFSNLHRCSGPSVILPDGNILTSTQQGLICYNHS